MPTCPACAVRVAFASLLPTVVSTTWAVAPRTAPFPVPLAVAVRAMAATLTTPLPATAEPVAAMRSALAPPPTDVCAVAAPLATWATVPALFAPGVLPVAPTTGAAFWRMVWLSMRLVKLPVSAPPATIRPGTLPIRVWVLEALVVAP